MKLFHPTEESKKEAEVAENDFEVMGKKAVI